MKIISIGDLHGRDTWKIIKPERWDKIVFIGDYVDSFSVKNVLMKLNLEKVINFKKQFPEKVILLWGNHDLQYYLGYDKHGCSGYIPEMRYDFYDLFKGNEDLFQVAYQVDNYLWTHAGIHKGWYKYRFQNCKWNKEFQGINKLTLAEQLNEAFKVRLDCLFDVGYRRGGIRDVGGIFWADKRETYNSPLEGYHQIVGHTKVSGISHYDISKTTSITYIDCLEFVDIPEFYELEIEGEK